MEASAQEVENGAKRNRNKNVASRSQRVDENRESLSKELKQHQSPAEKCLILERIK
jgi:hypothetical protein